MEERNKALKQGKELIYNNLAKVLQEKHLMDVKQMEEGSKALKQGKENFYNNLATVLQEKHLMRRETNGRKKLSFKAEERTIV